MKKLFIIFLFFIFPINIFAFDFDLNSESVLVVNRENGDILYKKNINDVKEVASLTKIMTTIVSLENIKDLNELVTIDYDDIDIPYDYVTIGLKKGMEISYNDLLYSTHPYKRKVIGSADVISTIRREEILEFFNDNL